MKRIVRRQFSAELCKDSGSRLERAVDFREGFLALLTRGIYFTAATGANDEIFSTQRFQNVEGRPYEEVMKRVRFCKFDA